MKKVIKYAFAIVGWLLLILFLGTTFFFNKFANPEKQSIFTPISWEAHSQVLSGAIACSLLPQELQDRLDYLKKEVFSKLVKKEEIDNGVIFYFDDEGDTASLLTQFIADEKKCCPFFKFDLSVQPFEKGIALQISGGKGVKDFIMGYLVDY